MKQLLTIFLLLSAPAFSQSKNDSTEIIELLVNDYKTLGNWDVRSHVDNCTDNYLLIEDGEIWDMKKESEWFNKNSGRVIERKDHFDIKYVRIYENVAYAVYNLRSDITEKGVLTVKNWIESTIFRKINGKWKLELINSTPVALKK